MSSFKISNQSVRWLQHWKIITTEYSQLKENTPKLSNQHNNMLTVNKWMKFLPKIITTIKVSNKNFKSSNKKSNKPNKINL